MEMNTVMTLLIVTSLMTTLITEGVKKIIPEGSFPKNLLAGIIAVLVSIGTSAGYITVNKVPVTKETVVWIITLTVFTWLGSMVGFDKAKQTIAQISGTQEN